MTEVFLIDAPAAEVESALGELSGLSVQTLAARLTAVRLNDDDATRRERLVVLRRSLRQPGHVFETRRRLAAPIARVYAAWTEPALMRRWMATVVEVDVRVGGKLYLEIHEKDGSRNVFRGEYLLLDPPRRLVKTFRHQPETGEYTDEYVAVELRALSAEETELTLQNGWGGLPIEDLAPLGEGWGTWLDQLRDALQRSQ